MITEKLQLIIGLPKAPGDPYSAEPDLQVLTLLSNEMGVGLIDNSEAPFAPKIAVLKGGGSWADSATSDGRNLLSTSVDNVTETMNLKVVESTHNLLAKRIVDLNRFVEQARKFTATYWQTQPVYIEWMGRGAPASQFALIYNIDMAITPDDYPEEGQLPSADVVITIEREPAWRALPPGANPKLWAFYARGELPGNGVNKFTYTDLSLISGTRHWKSETIQNRHEWAGTGSFSNPLSKNYVDIAATDVPGDAPALVCVSVDPATVNPDHCIIARSTKPTSGIDRNGVTEYVAYTFNAGDAVNGALVNTVKTLSANGLFSNGSSVNRYYATSAIPASSTALILWGSGGNTPINNPELLRGKFVVLIRGHSTTAAAQVYASLSCLYGSITVTLPEVSVPVDLGTTQPIWTYVGLLDFPVIERSIQSEGGTGRFISATNYINFWINYRNALASPATVLTWDMQFLPYDEYLAYGVTTASSGTPQVAFDGTGYFPRGQVKDGAYGFNAPTIAGGYPVELRGNVPRLEPNTAQRLYFSFAQGAPRTVYLENMTVYLNIIPRWYGQRDV